jgi:hypothetical protein
MTDIVLTVCVGGTVGVGLIVDVAVPPSRCSRDV